MPLLIATRQLVGDWGCAHPNTTFETDETTALNLESRGLAVRWRPPRVTYETGKMLKYDNKMLKVPENK